MADAPLTLGDLLSKAVRSLRSPECWCESCDIAANGGLRSRMSLCPACGDKRCPKAKHHDNDCQKAGHPTTPTPKD